VTRVLAVAGFEHSWSGHGGCCQVCPEADPWKPSCVDFGDICFSGNDRSLLVTEPGRKRMLSGVPAALLPVMFKRDVVFRSKQKF